LRASGRGTVKPACQGSVSSQVLLGSRPRVTSVTAEAPEAARG
jgi:hypothetical protein